MALRTHRRQARDCDRLAPERLSPFLDMEGRAWPTRASVDSERRTRADPSDEPREPDLGRPQDSRRAAQTRYEHRRDQREQVPGSSPEAAIADRSEEHTSELQSPCNLVCRLLLEKKKNTHI